MLFWHVLSATKLCGGFRLLFCRLSRPYQDVGVHFMVLTLRGSMLLERGLELGVLLLGGGVLLLTRALIAILRGSGAADGLSLQSEGGGVLKLA